MIVDEITLQRIQSTELGIFKEFLRCCEKYGLKYYLLGGTMLGAVRHQGFIPWDDDIDVGLPRKDYELFLCKAPSIFPEYYFVQSLDTEPEVLVNFAKIRDSRTTFIETSYRKAKINHGIYIDVFPLDYYPESEDEQKKIEQQKKALTLRIRRAFEITDENNAGFIRESFRDIRGCLLTLKYPSVREALLKRERLYTSVSSSGLLANYSGAWGKKEIVPASWYGEGVSARFEGLDVVIPTHYDKWLTQVYGNYMELPPKEKRVPHHYTDVIDLDRPYTDYIK